MSHIGQKVDGVIKYIDQKAHDKQIASIKEGDWVTTTYKKPRKPKTLPQLGYYYAVVRPIILQGMLRLGWTYTITVQGIEMSFPMTAEMAHLWLKNAFGPKGSMADWSCEEASDFLDQCINSGPYFEVDIPPPPKKRK